jgi:hypothetical protein
MVDWVKLELNVLPRKELAAKEIIPALIRVLEQADLPDIDTLEIRGELVSGALKVEHRAELQAYIREVLRSYGPSSDTDIGADEVNDKLLEKGVHATETQVARHLNSLHEQKLIVVQEDIVRKISKEI